MYMDVAPKQQPACFEIHPELTETNVMRAAYIGFSYCTITKLPLKIIDIHAIASHFSNHVYLPNLLANRVSLFGVERGSNIH